MDSVKAKVLRQPLIFSSLNADELAELASLAIERGFMPGEFVFWDGDAPDWFYMVAEGRIKVLKHSSTGEEFIIAFFGPGDMFGEVAVFENKPSTFRDKGVYVRAGATDRIATRAELDEFYRRPQSGLVI